MERILRELAKSLPKPGDVPVIAGLEIAGGLMPLNNQIGGDHLIYLDFNARYNLEARMAQARNQHVRTNLERNKRRAGILIADVSGHDIATAVIAAQLHQAFLLGVQYELERYGEITPRLFEELNSRFCRTSSRGEMAFITLLYGEIHQDGRFRFISAGHHYPQIFSFAHNCFVNIQTEEIKATQPIGMLPSLWDIDERHEHVSVGFKKEFVVNERQILGSGDILLLYTDGLFDHRNEESARYFPGRLEQQLQAHKHLPALKIYRFLRRDLKAYGTFQDDIGVVVIKKT